MLISLKCDSYFSLCLSSGVINLHLQRATIGYLAYDNVFLLSDNYYMNDWFE